MQGEQAYVTLINCNERERDRKMFLFNDAHNTFYQRLYGVRHMVKDHTDSEKGNPLPPHRLLLSINSKGSFICTILKDRIKHTSAIVTSVVEHWLNLTISPSSSSSWGARCSSVVREFAHGTMGRRIDPSWGGPIELLLVPASAPRPV